MDPGMPDTCLSPLRAAPAAAIAAAAIASHAAS